ncbi:nucleotide sugar dehydrogenase [Pectobacterium odoriferum]|uniref:nucleotide sugar dehydrogenase n=1 Tax=Pectobacterium odoriferum TaxID=78398 RepID=UPI00137439EB|nr:nucleotide sugar dehydrogenase [Pectobacterium odoriferum]QHP81218.1 nucleotide sugar dehydrogenase [Pectobacterium odoriferum]GKW04890.1 UDP-N-acetyl-D-galactosamine dehydrogenase [Pectobacterium carotovorum subsp. carotovorum]
MGENRIGSHIVAVIGLGYIGLPVVCEFSKYFNVIAYDCNRTRVEQLSNNIDSTGTNSYRCRNEKNIKWTNDEYDLELADFFIVCVPTPVDINNKPDITCLIKATTTVGHYLRKNSIVVYESTVSPGTTEEVCQPLLEEYAKLKSGKDFFIGFSPERLCPGDDLHSLVNTDKIVSCAHENGLQKIFMVYKHVYKKGIHKTSSIRSAEAAKILENIQRDVNIALINEVHEVFQKDNIDTYEVIRLASTKWNFGKYFPGLVGGHCISVDPYYFIDYANKSGHPVPLVSVSRKINEDKKDIIIEKVNSFIKNNKITNPKIAIFGVTYKENCTDTRNSKSLLMYQSLVNSGYEVHLNDIKLLNKSKCITNYDINITSVENISGCDVLIICVAHNEYKKMILSDYKKIINNESLIIDMKNVINEKLNLQLSEHKIKLIKG